MATNNFRQKHCSFCPSEVGQIVLKRTDFVARMCPRCGVIWCDPLRLDETFHHSNEHAYLQINRLSRKTNEKKLSLLSKFASPEDHPRLLEIGCMHGLFLSQAAENGYEVNGLDLSKSAIKVAKDRTACNVKVGTLNGKIEDNSADIICAFNVIEHMETPSTFVRESRKILSPGGILFIETPCKESIYHHVMFLLARLFPDSKYEVGIGSGGHIYKFGKKAWNNILTENGYEVIMMKITSTPILELLSKKRKSSSVVLLGLIFFGVLARLTGTGNRVLVIARSEKTF